MKRAATLLLFGLACSAAAQVQQLPPGTSAPAEGSSAAAGDTAANSAVERAETLMQAQDWQGAAALLQPLTALHPTNARVQYDLGFCLDEQNDTPGALAAYRRALQADPVQVAASVSLGLLLARTGDPQAAIAALSSATGMPGSDAPAMAAKAQAYRALARLRLAASPEQSRDDLVQALRLSPEIPSDVQLSGEIAESMGDDPAAAVAFERFLRLQPADPQAALQYARVLQHEGHPIEADATLDAALLVHPNSQPLLGERAASLLRQQKVEQALPLLKRLHAEDPANAANTRLLSRAYVAQGEFAAAGALLEPLTEAEPENGGLLAERADILMRERNYAPAQAMLERAVSARFDTPEGKAKAASALAFAASANRHPEVVLHAISIRNSVTPPDATSAFLLATAHDSLHQSREAAGAYRQFLQLANGQFPDETAQATQRLKVLSRAK